MIDENKKLEAGGRVKISGKWHDVVNRGSGEIYITMGLMHYVKSEVLLSVIEEYSEPEESPYEWVSGVMWNPWNTYCTSEVLNAFLTERYGDPTIRTYAGEDAGKYGLEDDCSVLYFAEYGDGDGDGGDWSRSRFDNLEAGDQWRKQPPSPKGVE